MKDRKGQETGRDLLARDGHGTDPDIGGRIRKARLLHGLTARQVADRAGVSPTYLSRLENRKVSPTVSTLSRIMRAIGEPVVSVFTDPPGSKEEEDRVVRRDARPRIQSRGVEDFLLSPSRAGRLEVMETIISPGAGSGEPAYQHPGDEECVVVLDGALRVWVGDTRYDLSVGDAITFACRIPHRWVNPGGVNTRVLWIITPAGY